MTKNVTYDLNKHTFHLLQNEPFWCELSARLNKRPMEAVKTAAMSLNKNSGHFELLYAPSFWARLASDEEKSLLLQHEFYHAMFGHVTSRMPAGGVTKQWNIAMDLAINSSLFGKGDFSGKPEGSLWKTACLPGARDFVDYPHDLSADAYYRMLGEDPNFDPSEYQTMDNHDLFGGDLDPEAAEIAKQHMKQAIKEAIDASARGEGWGSIPLHMQGEILKLLQTVIDWRAVLRYFIKTSQRSSKKGTFMRLNRRMPWIFPGRKSSRSANVAVAIDQSGSVSDELLTIFFAELNSLSKFATFTVIPFDSEVDEDKVYEWKKGTRFNAERVLSGGTDFNAPTRFVNEHGGFDGLIIATDMDAPAPIDCNVQRMWVTDSRGANHPYFSTNERVISLTSDDSKS